MSFRSDYVTPAFREEFRSSWSTAFYRWPAWPLSVLALRLGVSAMALTLIAGVIALSLPVMALVLPLAWASVAVCVGSVVFQVLDGADGMVARASGQVTRRGGDTDFLVDMAHWALLYVSIGILADRWAGGGWDWTVLAAVAAWGRLYARVIRDRLARGRSEPAPGEGPPPVPPRSLFEWVAAFVAGLSGLIPFLALTGPVMGWGVVALVVYSVLDIAEGATPFLDRYGK